MVGSRKSSARPGPLEISRNGLQPFEVPPARLFASPGFKQPKVLRLMYGTFVRKLKSYYRDNPTLTTKQATLTIHLNNHIETCVGVCVLILRTAPQIFQFTFICCGMT